ncbi:MAG: ABC transporter ATP-binding protein, partial [Candidatus Adiutrix sp.]
VMANKNIDFTVEEGEIHALMGENGAGKSTLMKILFGLESCDEGEITFNGQKLTKMTPAEIIKSGIGMVHQHFMLVDSLRVYENIILGIEPLSGLTIDANTAISKVKEIGQQYNLNVDPLAVVEDISVGLKQKVELLKVLMRGVKLLILDEPTAVLTPQETEELFEQLMLLKKSGHTIIFISHKIREVMQICERVTILRAGRSEATIKVADTTAQEISRLMVGRDVILKQNKKSPDFKQTILEVRNLNYTNRFGKVMLKNINFSLKGGQILAIAGVEGNGQNELAETIFGLTSGASGEILINGENILGKNIGQIRQKKLAYIPEDRITLGVAAGASIWENLMADRIDKPEFKWGPFLKRRKILNLAKKLIDDFDIRCRNLNQPVGMLSGGNMQKVVVAREFSANPDILLANQPTRGIDVGSNEFIWGKIVEKRDAGHAVILVSADLNEVLELADSIMVMCDGEMAAFFNDSRTVTEEELGLYMLGLKKQEAA